MSTRRTPPGPTPIPELFTLLTYQFLHAGWLHLIANMLFGVSPTDVITFSVVPAILALAALGASYLPALRATRIDPLIARRYE